MAKAKKLQIDLVVCGVSYCQKIQLLHIKVSLIALYWCKQWQKLGIELLYNSNVSYDHFS